MGWVSARLRTKVVHDRDSRVCQQFNPLIRIVVRPPETDVTGDELTESWPGEGLMVNSGPLEWRWRAKVTAASSWRSNIWRRWASKQAAGHKIRDWVDQPPVLLGHAHSTVYTADGAVPVPVSELPDRARPRLRITTRLRRASRHFGKLIPEFVDTPEGKQGNRHLATWACLVVVPPLALTATRITTKQDVRAREGRITGCQLICNVGGAEHRAAPVVPADAGPRCCNDLGYVPFIEPFKACATRA